MARRPDDELILFFYGEHPSPAELQRALDEDPELRRRYDALRGTLASLATLEAPEPRAGLESRMWARVAPELDGSHTRRPPQRAPRGWLNWAALAAAVIVVAILGFAAGRAFRSPVTGERELAATIEALTPEARDRVLTAALETHFESSERFLVEVSNGAAAADEERRFAAVLLSANRLYQRAAERGGQRRIAAVLAELEPLLNQLANGQPEETASDFRFAQERIEGRDLLFKVRVTRNRLKELS